MLNPDPSVMRRSWGSGEGTAFVYRLEARSLLGLPIMRGNVMLDDHWRPVGATLAEQGVPLNVYPREAGLYGFLNFAAAMTLAHWFLALEPGRSVEVRLVQIQFRHSYTTTEVGVGPAITADAHDTTFSKREEG